LPDRIGRRAPHFPLGSLNKADNQARCEVVGKGHPFFVVIPRGPVLAAEPQISTLCFQERREGARHTIGWRRRGKRLKVRAVVFFQPATMSGFRSLNGYTAIPKHSECLSLFNVARRWNR